MINMSLFWSLWVSSLNLINSCYIIVCLSPLPILYIPSIYIYPNVSGTNGKWCGSVSDNVKAVTIVALGKFCLQDHFIAKKYAIVFAHVLKEDSKPAVKINAMAALTDLCVRLVFVCSKLIRFDFDEINSFIVQQL